MFQKTQSQPLCLYRLVLSVLSITLGLRFRWKGSLCIPPVGHPPSAFDATSAPQLLALQTVVPVCAVSCQKT